MMLLVPRPAKPKKRKVHQQPINLQLAIGVLAIFVLAIIVYLAANYRKLATNESVTGGISGAAVVNDAVSDAKTNRLQMSAFKTLDDFKSYLDDGNRAYGGGIFDSQVAAAADTAAKIAAEKKPAKNQKELIPESIAVADANRYLSLGSATAAGDIIQTSGPNIYFSPENQFYAPKGTADLPPGETKIFNAGDAAAISQVGAIPQDGNFLIMENSLAVFLNNTLAVYDVAGTSTVREVWRARVGDGSRIIAAKPAGNMLYLAVRTAIDPANPCPIKPFALQDRPLVVDCTEIYHPRDSIRADSVFTLLEIGAVDGKITKSVSFIANDRDSAVLFDQSADYAYATWGKELDQISFFTDFLNDKCKGLLPNYLLEKTANISICPISRSAKEFELRGLLSGWFESLSAQEQTRISGEILSRLDGYLRDNFRDFERTEIAKINLDTFKFGVQTEISGKMAGAGFISESLGAIRALTVSGAGANQKMEWFITGKIGAKNYKTTVSHAYMLDYELLPLATAQDLDLPAQICAARFDNDRAYVSTCGLNDPFHIVSFNATRPGLQGKITAPANPAYLYPLGNDTLLAISKNNRKIKVALFDAVLAAKPQILSEFDLNDYWADMDANWRAFANEPQSKLFFLPAGKGGYIFSHADGLIEMVKSVGTIAVSRAFFRDGELYLAGDDGIEVFGGADFSKIKSVKF